MSISTFDLDSTAAGTGATASFTEQTSVTLFPNATLTTAGGNPGRVDSITITITGASATESLAIAVGSLPSGMTASYDSATGKLTLTKAGGTDAEWAAALQAVTYNDTSDAPSSSSRSITVVATDASGPTTSTANATINVTAVNDAPVNTVPGAQSAVEDTSKAISGLSITDVDAGSGTVTTTLSVTNGTITVGTVTGGAGISGNGTGTVTLTGTVAQINATLSALNNVTYLGSANFNGSDTLTMTTNDGGNTGTGGAKSDTDTVSITVSAVNDAPINTVPGAQSATEDTAKVITGISISDVDASTGTVTTTLSVLHGTITVATVGGGASVSGNGTGTVTLTGTVAQINATLAALNAVSYQGNANFNGSDTLTVTTNDGGNTGSGGAQSDTDTVSISVSAVNDAPVNTVPGAQTATEDTAHVITGLSVSDVDAGSASISTTLSVENGTLTVLTVSGGAGVSGSGTDTVTLTGTVAEINTTLAALNGVTYQGNSGYSGSDTLTVTTNDGGNTGSGGAQSDVDMVSITVDAVNHAPTGDVTISGDAVEDSILTASNTLDDPDGLGSISYQWVRDGTPIDGATDSQYTLTDADVGAAITVVASYTDGRGNPESVSSSATDPVENVNDAPTGDVTISGDAVQGETLTASNTLADDDGLGTINYQWLRDGSPIDGATDSQYTLTESDVGAAITVVASYTDGQGTPESVSSSATDAVENVNDAPTGDVTISGTATEGETLTASNTLADDDGLGTISYQWVRDGTPIDGATGTEYILTEDDVGASITVVASYTDGHGTPESVSSDATDPVDNVNESPTGDVTISGDTVQGETLSASNTLADQDGLGSISYQWMRDGTPIDGATSSDYVLTESDVGAAITVVASYTDGHGTPESVSSSATDAVENVNDAPTGDVTISGDAVQGEILTASNSLADDDGLGTISYQWVRDGTPIDGATDSHYTLTESDVGAAITVVASYTDGHGTPESVSSDATDPVENVNDAPTGDVTISGIAVVGETLSASNTLGDADGLGAISYQWARDGTPIDGATNADYTLTGDDLGAAISVVASYTDGHGTPESVPSSATDAVVIGLVINGTSGDDDLTGTAGNDIINGLAGADRMTGGNGDDTYYVDNAGDTVVENADEGTDEVRTTLASYVLASNVENLTGTVNTGQTLTGNGLDNVITAGSGDDTLDGGAGADSMTGGDGNDIYNVDDVGDSVTENANEGTDEVRTSLATYTLGSDVENLTGTVNTGQTLTGNGLNNVITAGSGNDTLDGGAGADRMSGGAGNDIYYVDNIGDQVLEDANGGTDLIYSSISYTLKNRIENLTLTGNDAINGTGSALDNIIIGNSANNILDGGGGADQLTGGNGDDTYYVDNVGDVVLELSGEGNDTVRSNITYALTANVENLTLAGTASINGTGNELDNVIRGNTGNNLIDGGAGVDKMQGGAGNDTYYVDNIADVVAEKSAGGTDLVYASVSYALSAQVENLVLTGTNSINGTGNDGDNFLTGNDSNNLLKGGAGADLLDGGLGNDTLKGGSGADVFMFTTALGASNVDAIKDFETSADHIVLDQAIFSALSTGPLSASEFVVGTSALDADDHIIYNQATGKIYYDADGNGAGAKVLFATVTAGTVLTSDHFSVADSIPSPSDLSGPWHDHSGFIFI